MSIATICARLHTQVFCMNYFFNPNNNLMKYQSNFYEENPKNKDFKQSKATWYYPEELGFRNRSVYSKDCFPYTSVLKSSQRGKQSEAKVIKQACLLVQVETRFQPQDLILNLFLLQYQETSHLSICIVIIKHIRYSQNIRSQLQICSWKFTRSSTKYYYYVYTRTEKLRIYSWKI